MRNHRKILVVLSLVLALVGMPTVAAAQSNPTAAPSGPLALVYRGPASCSGCPESVAVALRNSPSHFRTEYVGPNDTPITAATLARATVFAQPGGPSLSKAWKAMKPYSGVIRDWIRNGGNYLGFCVGGYLAGATPGYNLLPGDTSQYSAKPGATVWDVQPHRSTVVWRGQEKTTYFQDPPAFDLEPGHNATVLATYKGGEVAALAVDFGKGRVGVTGPHVEADSSWFVDDGLSPDGAVNPQLAYDLIETTVQGNKSGTTPTTTPPAPAPTTTAVAPAAPTTTPPAPAPTTTVAAPVAPTTTPPAPAPTTAVAPVPTPVAPTTAPPAPTIAAPPTTTTPATTTTPPTTTAVVTTPARPALPWPFDRLAELPFFRQFLTEVGAR
ncbi:BPL-N domain-containing protein [Rhodococcus sp. NPDC127528]|uniref:BPL-N domain-containing protein n=1 Tax=unclassified Rhodococcus (in: high G+C Gram-positive bacteria) TaxID=192944 RepID=UPI003643CAA2